MKSFPLVLLPGLCLMLSSFPVWSQTTTPDSALLSPQQLQPVEVRALRAGSDAPFAKTDLSSKQLEQRNLGQDLPFLLQYTPSAVVTSDAGGGVGYTGLRIRGTDGTRINVTLNGVPVNDAESQGTFFVDLPDLASSTSSIQIQRGVGTSTNGGGAFGATVSISNLDLMPMAGAEAAVSFGSFNTQKYTVRAGTGWIADRFALDLRLSNISSDGFIDRSASDLKALQLNAAWKITPKTSLRFLLLQGQELTHQAWNGVPEEKLRGNDSALLAHYYNNAGTTYFTPGDSANLFSSDPRRYNGFTYDNQVDHYRQHYYQLFADHRFSPAITAHAGLFLTRGLGYYEEYRYAQKLKNYSLQPFTTPAGDTFTTTDLIRQLWLDNYHYGAVFSLLYDHASTKATFGGGWSRYDGEHYGFVNWAQYGVPAHYRWYHLDARKSDANLYAKAEHHVGNLVLFGDVQWRHVAYAMNGFRNNPALRPSVSYDFFNPKAGLTWWLHREAARREKVYASFALAHHEPNRDDFEAAPGSLPRPERLTDWEGGYELERRTWSAGLNLYYMQYRDQLVLTGQINDVGAYTRTNVPQSYRAGVELQAAWKPADWVQVQANGTFSQNRILDFREYIDNYDSTAQSVVSYDQTEIAFSPAIIAGGAVTVQPFTHTAYGKGLSVEIAGKYVSRQYLDNTGNEQRSIDPYALCDVRIRYLLPQVRPFREWGLSLALNNVFDQAYESNGYTFSYIYGGAKTTQNYYYPQAGFNFLAGLTVKW